MQGLILPFNGCTPKIAPDAFIAPGAAIIGDVEIGARSSVWFSCVVRGDFFPIRIGERSNIQDGTVVHVTGGKYATHIGSDVLVGHACIIHGCTLEDWAFVGMGAVVMDDVIVESGAMVAAGALVTPGKRIKAGEVWGGSPAKFLRPLAPKDVERNRAGVGHYIENAQRYRAQLQGG
jgi:carbonic anhydrase/acetyltransferase-like protein (isoleucine patch superfamily)